MLKAVVILIISTFLTGCGACGFQLRGTHTIPDYLKTVYITPDDPYDPFQRTLRKKLCEYKVHIICEPRKGVTTLELSPHDVTELALAAGPQDGQVLRYKYIYSVKYRLITDDVNYTRTVIRSRELSRNNNALLSNDSERQIVNRELMEEAVNELLRRITSGPPHNVVSDTPPADNNPC